MAITRIKSSNIEDLDSTKLTGTVDTARIPNLDAAKITSGDIALARLDNAPATDLSKLEYNQAILAFKIASSNQLAKFSMVDQVIDEYQDATGIDAGASTNEVTNGTGTAKYYEGNASSTPTVSGNYDSTATDGDYTYYKWTTVRSDGTYTTNIAGNYDYLVIAGGGGGGKSLSTAGRTGAGGGAGAFRYATGFAVAATTITGITVGDGGTGGVGTWGASNYPAAGGVSGNDSVFSTITADGGGGGAAGYQNDNADGKDGGSGGGGHTGAGAGSATLSGLYGNDGGIGGGAPYNGAGGGGMGSVGGASASVGGNGGTGVANSITGSSVSYAGGGAGSGAGGPGTASHGGGADAVGTSNTGGGGSGRHGTSGDAFKGGSGIVIIRRLTTVVTLGGNLTLQSTATTAESAPTTADLVVLIEDNAGTATINTDIKGFVSRNGSAFSTAVTFVDEGDWGTNKRILVARNIDISGITTGTAMKYKLTSHNQSAGSKETRIHATSLAWA